MKRIQIEPTRPASSQAQAKLAVAWLMDWGWIKAAAKQSVSQCSRTGWAARLEQRRLQADEPAGQFDAQTLKHGGRLVHM